MIQAKVKEIFQELSRFSSIERYFVLAAMLCGLLIAADYTTVRSVSNSLFLTCFGASSIPYAWLATLPFNFLVIAFYNRYLAKLGCKRMLTCIIGLIMGVNLVSYFFIKSSPSLCFFFYMWKEVYVLVMFQQLWSIVHATIDKKRARYLYGILFACGGIGGMLGSCLPRFFAVTVGSDSLILATLGFYLILFYGFSKLYKYSTAEEENSQYSKENYKEASSILHSFRLISKSSLLTFILISVIFMQLTSAVVDFQFNTFLGKTILDTDLRTEYYGRAFGYVNILSTTMQLFGTLILLRFAGLRNSHYFVPGLLLLNAIGFFFFPTFGLVTMLFVATRGFDFSLFGVIKEMLYVNLPIDEKFRSKAIIDVFAHRSTKALAALLVLGLQFFNIEITRLLTITLFGIFILWMFCVAKLYKEDVTPATTPSSDEPNITG